MQISSVLPLEAPAGEFLGAVTVGGRTDVVYARSSDVLLSASGDALLALALEPSMHVGGVLEVPRALSPAVHESCGQIQDLLVRWSRRGWCPPFFRVRLRTSVRFQEDSADSRGVAAFFSGGIDSTFTALKHRDEITHLVFVEDFDLPGAREDVRTAALETIHRAADVIGKPLIVVKTNLREFSDPWVDWDFYHGAGLAALAHLMSERFSKVYVASSATRLPAVPWGSHPGLDPLWGNERLSIEHDGEGLDRTRKLLEISKEPAALRWLRVCWERPGMTPETINCGRCRKCAGAVLSLRTLGIAERVATLPENVEPEVLARARLRYKSWRLLWMRALRDSLRDARDMPTARALATALVKSYARRPLYGTRRLLAGLDYTRRSIALARATTPSAD